MNDICSGYTRYSLTAVQSKLRNKNPGLEKIRKVLPNITKSPTIRETENGTQRFTNFANKYLNIFEKDSLIYDLFNEGGKGRKEEFDFTSWYVFKVLPAIKDDSNLILKELQAAVDLWRSVNISEYDNYQEFENLLIENPWWDDKTGKHSEELITAIKKIQNTELGKRLSEIFEVKLDESKD